MNKSFVLLWVGVVGLILFFWIYFPTLSHYRELKFQEEDMQQQVSKLDQKITQLTEERELLKNDRDYVEKVIRDELGLVKPGEVVYKFVRDDAPLPVETSKVEAKTATPAAAKVADKKAAPEKISPTAVTLKALPVPKPVIPVKGNPAAPEAETSAPVSDTVPVVLPVPPSGKNPSSDPVYPRQETR